MKLLSISKVKFSNENDESLKFIMTFEEANFSHDEKSITFEKYEKQLSATFNKKEDVVMAGQIHYHFVMNGYELRLIVMNETAEKLHGKQDTIIIASKRHDNFVIYFDLIDIEGSGILNYSTKMKLRKHESKKIEFIKLVSNPLKIIEKDPFGIVHKIPDLTNFYTQTIGNGFLVLKQVKPKITFGDFYEMVSYYAIELMIHYQKKAQGILPRDVVVELRNQIVNASIIIIPNSERAIVSKLIDEFTTTYNIIEKLNIYKSENNLQETFDG